MFRKNILIVLVMGLALLAGCSKPGKEPVEGKSTKKIAGPIEAIGSLTREFSAPPYSDNIKWLNGINRVEKNQFCITIGKNDPIPVNRGYKLKFAASGEATIQKLSRVEKPDNSMIYITVDKNLDPTGDGNPNSIYIKSFPIRPSTVSRENELKNGIYLKKAGTFVFVLNKNDATPIKIGDRLRFAASGEAIVKKIVRIDGIGPKGDHSKFIVTVDRSLDPAGDGGPNLIEVIIDK
jgi:hypothetical protein